MKHLLRALAASVLTLAAVPASASATVLWPDSDTYTAQSTSTVEFHMDTLEIECPTSGWAGTIPAEPDNEVPDEPITVDIDTPSFGACDGYVHQPGMGEVAIGLTVTPNDENGSWQATYEDDGSSPAEASLIVPEDGLVVELALAGCEYNFAPSAPAAIPGEWTNGADSDADPSVAAYDAAAVPIERETGSCATPTEATFSGAYEVRSDQQPDRPVLIAGGLGIKWRANNADYAGNVTVPTASIAFRWSVGANDYHVTCDWSATGSVTNASALRTGTGTLTLSIANCSSMLPAGCTFSSFAAIGDWALKGELLQNVYTLRIFGGFRLITTGQGGGGCSLPATANWANFNPARPVWTNGTAPGHSTMAFSSANSAYWISPATNPKAHLDGTLSIRTAGGDTLTML